MGVHGLWKLLEPAGKAVALESLQNKILGVDVSIWLHQAMKGFQDRKGSPLPNAHLLGVFHRVCKLLFYRIKPVFVFDGGVPVLKKNTIATRRKFKGQAARDAKQVAEKLLKNLVKHKAVRKVLGEKTGRNAVSENFPRKEENLFELPPMLNDLEEVQSISSTSDVSVKYETSGGESDSDQDVKYLSPSKVYAMNLDLHTLDVTSENFRSLPADVRHDILSDLKETRKQSSWGRLHEMPKESTDFSSFQLNRLLKRRNVQVSLEEAEKEMGGKVLSMAELEDIMSAQGVKVEDGIASSKEAQLHAFSKRIASDVATRYFLLSGSSQNKDVIGENESDTKKDVQEDTKEKTNKEIKIKEEYEDDWSSDEGSIKAVKTVKKNLLDDVQIKQEYEDDWSCDDQARETDENLAQQFGNKNDNLSQMEILALIQDEKERNTKDIPPIEVGNTSRANKQLSRAKTSSVEPSTSESNFVAPSTSKADSGKSRFSGVLVCSKADFGAPSKEKTTDEIRDGNPVTMESASDTDFDEVVSEPEIIDKVSHSSEKRKIQNIEVVIDENRGYQPKDDIFADVFPYKGEIQEMPGKVNTNHEKCVKVSPSPEKLKAQKIEIIIDKNQSYQPEDDIFADIFPVTGDPKGEIEKMPENVSPQQEKSEIKVILEKSKNPLKDFGQQEKVENTVLVKIEGQLGDQKNVDGELNESAHKAPAQTDLQETKGLEVPPMSSEKLKSLESALEEEHEELLAEKGRQERLAASITDQMCTETQELLRLFGVPYIVAPMEAEAQCAFLDSLSLTEGTITDDSDIWLFGGNKVFKNFFNQKKHVLQYTSTTIQHYLKLDRNHMVLLALLVGSDYTTGLEGIGPVTAMEVLAAFPPGKVDKALENRTGMIEGLRRFRDWWQAGRPERSAATKHLRTKVKDVQFYEGFPSLAVVDAYLRPAIDDSKEAFSWGDLDLEGLREFARIKFGWAQAKADQILLPVAKRVAERKNQRFIDSYFNVMPQYNEGDKKMSKRVKRAIRRMENEEDGDSEDTDDPGEGQSPQKKSAVRRGGNVKKRRVQDKEDQSGSEEVDNPGEGPSFQKSSRNVQKKKVNENEGQKASNVQRKPAKRTKHDSDTENVPKMKIIARADGDVESTDSCLNDLPKPRPRQRTSTGVIRTGAGTRSTGTRGVQESVETQRKPTENSREAKGSAVKNPTSKPDKSSLNPIEGNMLKKTVQRKGRPRGKASNEPEQFPLEEALDVAGEAAEIPDAIPLAVPGPSDVEPRAGPSREAYGPDEEEEAILAALHAMDWDDDPWGGFEPPREKIYFGGVRKNSSKPRRAQPPQPDPPPPPAQPTDTRGYRPGTRTVDRIESRLTHPQLEWNTPSTNIPQKEKDRQQAEESKMKAIKLFKSAGATRTSKLLGEDPANSKRKLKKRKTVAKVKELDLSEDSSDD